MIRDSSDMHVFSLFRPFKGEDWGMSYTYEGRFRPCLKDSFRSFLVVLSICLCKIDFFSTGKREAFKEKVPLLGIGSSFF